MLYPFDVPQCYHFQQFYNRHNVKVYVPIIRWSHCVSYAIVCYCKSIIHFHHIKHAYFGNIKEFYCFMESALNPEKYMYVNFK